MRPPFKAFDARRRDKASPKWSRGLVHVLSRENASRPLTNRVTAGNKTGTYGAFAWKNSDGCGETRLAAGKLPQAPLHASVADRFKATVLKIVGRKARAFESHRLRFGGMVQLADTSGLNHVPLRVRFPLPSLCGCGATRQTRNAKDVVISGFDSLHPHQTILRGGIYQTGMSIVAL